MKPRDVLLCAHCAQVITDEAPRVWLGLEMHATERKITDRLVPGAFVSDNATYCSIACVTSALGSRVGELMIRAEKLPLSPQGALYEGG